MNENELMHFGVLGMKWGKRKQRSSNGKLAKKKQIKRTINTKNDDVPNAKLTKKQKDLLDKHSKLSISEIAVNAVRSISIARDMGPLLGLSYSVADAVTTKNKKKKNYMYRSGMYDL